MSVPPQDPPENASGPADQAGEDGRAARAQRRRQERREAILEAAKDVFVEKGYHPVSVGDIIERAGIARGTFYLYFTNKQDIFQALLEEFFDAIRGQVRRIETEPGSEAPEAQLRDNLHRVVRTLIAHRAVADIVLRDPASFDEASRTQLEQFWELVTTLMEAAMRVGQNLGLVRECHVQIATLGALGAAREVLRHMITHDNLDTEQLAEELIGFCLRGVGGPAWRDP